MCEVINVDLWDMPNNFCFHVQAQNSIYLACHLPWLKVIFHGCEVPFQCLKGILSLKIKLTLYGTSIQNNKNVLGHLVTGSIFKVIFHVSQVYL